ncbi:other/FunK1 protein kinase [Coprinopsis cinerea okayama7|uniref:Other/FunK1 protein kinase n=1 Tax=Coprinopsis cinerea (strain Okayama-7 / 130 / ATCC MYA-4618 / FGSC 9003) TaxID=240176 RepID=D6RPL7_COPC7|nr:other/FunK1 protein kinase [Coprinopsis cinerea okayama7\|eukprot:XP_002910486.1 other/FunK1 protein kinase [Coprinopsis cinerea okayama7\
METNITNVGIDNFLNDYLPNDWSHASESVLADLKRRKVLISRGPSARRKPSSSTQRPPYTHALKTFKSVFSSKTVNPNRLMKSFQSVWNAVRRSLSKIEDTSIDEACIRPIRDYGPVLEACVAPSADEKLRLSDVVVPLMVARARNDRDECDEEPDVISRSTDILDDDARRTFVYGVTLDEEKISVYYVSRMLTARSEPFSMIEHPDLVVRIAIGLLCAVAQKSGHDPLVTLLPDGTYVYELPPDTTRNTALFYQTIRLLSHPLSVAKSRVWRVRQVVSNLNPTEVPGAVDRVLKAVFLDEDVQTEVEIQGALFSDIAAFGSDKDWRTREIVKDFEQADLESLGEALQGDNFKSYFSCIVASHKGNPSSMPLGSSRKSRCLFVYDSLCSPLDDIATLGEAMAVLRQCVIALRLMFCAGWVHRDLSPGNILAYRPTQDAPLQAKLSDLEHATRFPNIGAVQSKAIVGTPHFMACEIQTSRHFLPIVGGRRVRGYVRPAPKETPPMIHNYQHDLESLWWITLWLISTRVDEPLPRVFGRSFFQQRVDHLYGSARGSLLSQSLLSNSDLRRSLPSSLDSFLTNLDNLRNDLFVDYMTRNEAGKQSDVGTYSWVLSEPVSAFFDGISESQERWAAIRLVVESEMQREDRPVFMVDNESPGPSKMGDIVQQPGKRKRSAAEATDHPSKRICASRMELPVAGERCGPITRSMTRAAGARTRAATRRLR